MKINFTKMHGAGNDFVVIHDKNASLEINEAVARKILDRRYGVGADQLLLLLPHKDADFEMRIYNADGSQSEMCGNGIRCAAIFAKKHGLVKNNDMIVKTLAGIIKPSIIGDKVRVDMGEPIFDGKRIPAKSEGEILDYPLETQAGTFKINCVSMGNPHCVIYVDDVEKAPVTTAGPAIETHQFFPKRTNVEFVEVISRDKIKMRVWERGAGETLACGTGACASAVISMRKGFVDERVTVVLRGGDLLIEWREGDRVFMTGPAVEVFVGEIEIN